MRGLIVFVAYYLMMTAGRVTGEMGLVHPLLGLWAPNVFFGIIGVVMLVRSANEKPLYWMDGLRALAARGLADDALQAGETALGELRFRRQGLAASLISSQRSRRKRSSSAMTMSGAWMPALSRRVWKLASRPKRINAGT